MLKFFKNISIISYVFYSYTLFLIARSFAYYPRDMHLHIIASVFSLLIYIIFISNPPLLKSFINKCEVYLSKYRSKMVLIPISMLLLLGLIYSTFPVISIAFSNDEGNNLYVAEYILNNGLDNLFKNYASIRWIGNQHPFLVPLIYSMVFKIFGVHLYVARVVTLIFSALTLFFTYLLGKELYNREVGFFSAIFLLLAQIYFRLSCAALMDIQLTLFFVLSLYLFLRYLKMHMLIYAILCGISIGIGLLIKYPMAVIYFVLFAYILLIKIFLKEIKSIGIWVILIMSVVIFMPWLAFLYKSKTFIHQYNQISNTCYNFWKYKFFIVSRFLFDLLPTGISAQNIPFFLIGLFKVLKNCRRNSSIFILSWLICIFIPEPLLFNIRYTLPAYPAMAILMAYGLVTITHTTEKIKLILLSTSYLCINLTMYLFVSSGYESKFALFLGYK